ncbi:MAG: hypothetical protein FWH56_08765 [Betaproteobacteria bacterium]|nr:hypothetical protein [Betaproteobacteria bacterium]
MRLEGVLCIGWHPATKEADKGRVPGVGEIVAVYLGARGLWEYCPGLVRLPLGIIRKKWKANRISTNHNQWR